MDFFAIKILSHGISRREDPGIPVFFSQEVPETFPGQTYPG